MNDVILKHSLYRQFCAGENENDVRFCNALHDLNRRGVGAILDYAAEDDIDSTSSNSNGNSNGISTSTTSGSSGSSDDSTDNNNRNRNIVTRPPFNQPARIYEYQSEQKCDEHVEIFKKCIRAVQKTKATTNKNSNTNNNNLFENNVNVDTDTTELPGFAAIKITALCNPLLLERLSTAMDETKALFAKFDTDGDGVLTRDDFVSAYNTFFNNDIDIDCGNNGNNGNSGSDGYGNKNDNDNNNDNNQLSTLLNELDPNHTNKIDYTTFTSSNAFTFSNLAQICSSCKSIGPLSLSTPSEEELHLFRVVRDRVHDIANEARKCNVRLLIDAEQCKYQPAIDFLALDLQKTFNNVDDTDVPMVFNTYQCYLVGTEKKVEEDVRKSSYAGYHFGAKLVRGAYIVHERERAEERGVKSPIHSSIEETHDCYNNVLEMLLRKKVSGDANLASLEVMCATHNQESIERALDLMEELGLNNDDNDKQDGVGMGDDSSNAATCGTGSRAKPSSAVHFAQLYGMSDNLTFPLGEYKYKAYKYVPYGRPDEVLPYLIRRAQENSDVFGNASTELRLLFGELKQRFKFI